MSSPLLDDFHIYDRPELDDKALALLYPHVDASTLRWAARPKQGILRRHGAGCLALFFWCFFLFSIFWTIMVVRRGDVYAAFCGTPFLLIGGYMTLLWPLHDAWYRRKVAYALSQDHLYLLRSGEFESIPLHTIKKVVVRYKNGHRGDIFFGPLQKPKSGKNTQLFPSSGQRLQQIDQVDQVYEWILHASQALH